MYYHQEIDVIEPTDKISKLEKILAKIMSKKNNMKKLINQDVGIKKIINLIFKENYKKNNKAAGMR